VSDNEQTRRPIYQIRGGKEGRPPGELPRRLAAIVAADIAGYSRLMGRDEEGTHSRIKRHRRELVEPTIAEHHGKLIKYTGDGFLAMFDSPVEAVRCAIVIQQSMIGRNASLPRDQWILYRIGVHLGDVIVEPEDIYGDGVNIAARLEGIANPGDVFISGGVYEQIKNKLVCAYQSLGDRQVKNITDPVAVYRVLPDPAAVQSAKKSNRGLAVAISTALLVLGGLGGYYFYVTYYVPAPSAPFKLAVPNTPQPAPADAVAPPHSSQQAATTKEAPTPEASSQTSASPITIPEMVSLPGGLFAMGSNEDPSEKPTHRVTIKPFSISKFPVTVREWNRCAAAQACSFVATGEDTAPATNLSWNDAQEFVAWLSRVTQKQFRLPTEAEWEYAARAGTGTKYWWGDQFQPDMANCKGCGGTYDPAKPLKVGSFKANPFGLYDMGGSVDQWVEDCWHKDYQGAPTDGSAWIERTCSSHVIRSGSWKNDRSYTRPSNRDHYDTNVRYPTHGFRIAVSP
jgi:formylglycine-generating enzyme required for sulfatase activity/class 3 adenylate cyclase